MNFPGGSLCSSNRHEFSRRAYRKDMFFKEVLSVRRTDLIISSNRYKFSQKPLFSPRTHTNFSRSLYLVLEQILIFQEALFSPRTHTIFQETLSSPRTHTIFQEPPTPRTHRHFPGRYPLSNRYFVNRSRWLLSNYFDDVN